MDGSETESCGRCAMTSVADMTDGEDEGGGGGSPPFDEDRIELDDSELRTAAFPMVLAGRVKQRVDELALRIIHGQ